MQTLSIQVPQARKGQSSGNAVDMYSIVTRAKPRGRCKLSLSKYGRHEMVSLRLRGRCKLSLFKYRRQDIFGVTVMPLAHKIVTRGETPGEMQTLSIQVRQARNGQP